MVMLESLHEHCPQALVHVLCLSDECHTALTALNYPFVRLIRLAELEKADPELLAVRPTRRLVEYYFTLTPCLPWYILHTVEGIDAITYLDADMMFFSSPEPIFEEAGDASVILTPHRFSRHLEDRSVYGIYNVSWLTFSNTAEGLNALSWYRNACLEWCHDTLEDDRFADQKYLDKFPSLFAKVHVMQHPGGGLAPWNLEDAHIEQSGKQVTVGQYPLVFYHAHGFKHISGPFWASGLLNYHTQASKILQQNIFCPYAKRLAQYTRTLATTFHFSTASSIRNNSPVSQTFWGILQTVLREWQQKTLVTLKEN